MLTKRTNRWLITAEVVALIAVLVAAICVLPWCEALRMATALTVAYAVPRCVYARSGHATLAGHVVLLLAALWLMAIAVPFVYACTVGSGSSFQMPQLYGDAGEYYDWALAHYDGSALKPKVTFWGYSLWIVGLWKLLGVNVIWPVAANVLATLFTIVLTGGLAARIAHARHARVATLAMAMIAVQGFFMSQGAQMLKEPWVYLAITLIAYALVPGSSVSSHHPKAETRRALRYALVYTLGCFILAAVRAKYVNFMFVAIVMLAVAGRMRQWRHYGVLLGITLVCWWLGMSMTDHYTAQQQVNNITGEGGMATLFESAGPYQRIIGDYFHYPVWKKLLYLPLTFGLQWVIPFPWLPSGEQVSWLSIAPRLRLGWYVLSGAVVFFYLFGSWRRGLLWMAWAWIPMVCVVGIAYMTSGTVSRYILPFEPWWMALAAPFVSRLLEGNTGGHHRRFIVFMIAYVLMMAVVLALCRVAT